MPEIIPNWHPIFVHFTVGLLGAAVIMYLLSGLALGLAKPLHTAARINLIAGVLVTVGTVLTGWYAYNTVAHDAASHEVMTTHRNWALFTAAVFLVLMLWALNRIRQKRREGPLFLLAIVLAAVPLSVTGFLGGELVYRHGVGVLSLPDTDDHHHHDEEHEHRHDHDHDHESEDHHDHEDEHSGHEDAHAHDDEADEAGENHGPDGNEGHRH